MRFFFFCVCVCVFFFRLLVRVTRRCLGSYWVDTMVRASCGACCFMFFLRVFSCVFRRFLFFLFYFIFFCFLVCVFLYVFFVFCFVCFLFCLFFVLFVYVCFFVLCCSLSFLLKIVNRPSFKTAGLVRLYVSVSTSNVPGTRYIPVLFWPFLAC